MKKYDQARQRKVGWELQGGGEASTKTLRCGTSWCSQSRDHEQLSAARGYNAGKCRRQGSGDARASQSILSSAPQSMNFFFSL